MEVIEVVKNKVKLKLIRAQFCMGIGLDQITPEYHQVVFSHVVGYTVDKSKPVDTASIHNKPVNTDKLYKSNYGRRVSFKK